MAARGSGSIHGRALENAEHDDVPSMVFFSMLTHVVDNMPKSVKIK